MNKRDCVRPNFTLKKYSNLQGLDLLVLGLVSIQKSGQTLKKSLVDFFY